jgi:dimethylargininase
MINGLTSASLGKPDYALALEQHADYTNALVECGLNVDCIDADNQYPDCTFIEDTALVTAQWAIVTRPGADSRRGETVAVERQLAHHFPTIHKIEAPGTLDAGDVMMVGKHFFIGLSERTNAAGANALIALLETLGCSGTSVSMNDMLHLKTGLSYLENNVLLVSGEFVGNPLFESFDCIEVDASEAYAANSVWINGTVLVPAGNPRTAGAIAAAGYQVREVSISEFRKLDGGLSCLSLRF